MSQGWRTSEGGKATGEVQAASILGRGQETQAGDGRVVETSEVFSSIAGGDEDE